MSNRSRKHKNPIGNALALEPGAQSSIADVCSHTANILDLWQVKTQQSSMNKVRLFRLSLASTSDKSSVQKIVEQQCKPAEKLHSFLKNVETAGQVLEKRLSKHEQVRHWDLQTTQSHIKSLNDLICLDDESFLHAAYYITLGRHSDMEGFNYYSSRIGQGVSKLEILGQLRASQEGRGQEVRLTGLDEAIRSNSWHRLAIVKSLTSLWTRLSYWVQQSGVNQIRLAHKNTLQRQVLLGKTQQVIAASEIIGGEKPSFSLITYKPHLHPINQLSLDTSKGLYWVSQGDDPAFSLEVQQGLFAQDSWFMLELAIHSEIKNGIAKFYLDMGDGYNEAETLVLPFSSDEFAKRVFQITKPVLAIRFDPQEGAGRFRVDTLQFSAISEEAAMLVMTDRLAKHNEMFAGKNTKEIMLHIDTLKLHNRSPLKRLASLYSSTFISSQSRIDYQEWIERVELPGNPSREDVTRIVNGLACQPLISVLLPTFNSTEVYLRQCIESVIGQTYQNWELCVADDASTHSDVRRILEEYKKSDARIHVVYRSENGHISAASNSALKIAHGDYVALLDHDDVLPVHALYFMVLAINQHPSAKVLYSDEDKVDAIGNRFSPHFKSDWNQDLFYAQNYVSHLGIYRGDMLKQIGGFRLDVEGSQDHDLLLRCLPFVKPDEIVHIPRVLYHWRAVKGSTAMATDEKSYTVTAGTKALKDYFNNCGHTGVAVMCGAEANTYRIKWPLPQAEPLVSLIIPTRDNREITETCVRSIIDKSTYKNYEILILDNGSVCLETLEFFNKIQQEDTRVKVLRYDFPFNYSAINNFGVGKANGEIIGLVNNDIEVISPEWLSEMVSHVCRPEIGCVGAKLYYANNTIQHAGVICGVGGVAGHSHKYWPKKSPGYFSRLILTQNMSAVTGACLLVRRGIYEEVGGLDEKNLVVAFNDVDFCIKVRAAGYRNLWTPYAELYHHESTSRGTEDTPEKQARFQKEATFMKTKWGERLTRDPYYSPHLTRHREDFSIGLNIA
jgi:glycosyltransferase involved in cell wall biosynthesis